MICISDVSAPYLPRTTTAYDGGPVGYVWQYLKLLHVLRLNARQVLTCYNMTVGNTQRRNFLTD